jgi:hypothetical protein
MPDVWILYRAQDHPRIGNFAAEDEAQDFADEYGLLDWRPLQIKRSVELFDGQEHTQVCSACGEDWPCRVERIERKARSLSMEVRGRCAKCGKLAGWTEITVPGGGLLGDDAVYCGRVGSACRKFALAELLRLGRQDLHDKAEAERAERSAELARRKEARAQRRRIWAAGVDVVSSGDSHQPGEGAAG